MVAPIPVLEPDTAKPVEGVMHGYRIPLAKQNLIDVNYFCRLATIILAGS